MFNFFLIFLVVLGLYILMLYSLLLMFITIIFLSVSQWNTFCLEFYSEYFYSFCLNMSSIFKPLITFYIVDLTHNIYFKEGF